MTDAKRMDVHEVLDEVKAQKEQLEKEIHTKTDLCNNLKKSQDELIMKFQEAKLHSEKHAQELSAKCEELSTLSLLHQDLKASFREKELSVKQLNSATEKLRSEYGEKVQKLEGENKELVLALDEATTNFLSLKSEVEARHTEIANLKRVISLKDKKLHEIADRAQKTKDLTQRDAVICDLEEKHRDVLDQLKWRNEQFQHLEEAHKRLQDNFTSCKAEWEKEKSSLIKEICSLQTSLDSRIRLSETLQTELRRCNQALAHEESARKLLEVEVSEYKARYENKSTECLEAKTEFEKLTHKRDREVAELRDTLAAKDSISKEMEYRMVHLEQDNKDLAASLKEFQESQIASCGNMGSLKKLQKKFNGLEQVHKKCGQYLKEKDVQWNFELEKVRKEMDGYLMKLEVQREEVERLQEDLESCHLSSEVHNVEMSSVVLVLESQFSEAYSKLKLQNKENKEMVQHLTAQLEIKNNALCELKATLSKRCEASSDDMKQRGFLMEEVINTHKKMLAESLEKQTLLEEQLRVLEDSRKQDNRNGSETLPQKLVELEKRELLAESHIAQLEMKNQSLSHRVNEQSEKIIELQKQIVLLETLVTESTETIEAQKQEKEKYIEVINAKESSIENLSEVIEERRQKMEELVEESKALKSEKISALKTYEETRIEINAMHQALQKLKFEVSDLREKLKVKDESLVQSTQRAKELETLIQTIKLETENRKKQSEGEKMRLENLVKVYEVQLLNNKSETENLKEQAEDEKMRLENLVRKSEVQNQALSEYIKKLLSHNEDLLTEMEKSIWADEYSQDVELTGMLEKLLKSWDTKKGDVNLPVFPLQKGKSEIADAARLPLLDLNKCSDASRCNENQMD
uniref:uncharacterized protein At4g38062-like n=1 Tax=Erigeron canadensis TaxID=72917 RepID=UPI001CB9210B|nr:uncharacterized protein At4g38062-like [Erigeron canadensis]